MWIKEDVWAIGDPHMGKDFKTGVPIHRRGEREIMQMEQFVSELATPCKMNIMVGDLFDKPFVPLSIIISVAHAYREAARASPDTVFVVMAGNHDLSRQHAVRGAFHALALMIGDVPNIKVLFEPAIIDDFVFFPWQWDVTAAQQVEKFDALPPCGVGHWDLSDYGGSTEHMCPAKLLHEKGSSALFSGHYHTVGDYVIDGIVVVCTGSMQPYSHAEDDQGSLYITLTTQELESIDPTTLRNKNVRIVLAPGEPLPEIDCLSIIPKREGEAEEFKLEEVGINNFDLSIVLEQKFEELKVPIVVQSFIKEKLGAID